MCNRNKTALLLAQVLILLVSPASAYEITDRFSLGGVVAAAVQCQELSDQPTGATDDESTCEGGAPIQLEASWRPTDDDEVFIKLGAAADNSLNTDSSLPLASWAADLKDDVRDINGRDRDHLLAAWYKHTFSISEESNLGVTFGIIDATDYIDDNAYANDEYTQFMNEALVNGPNFFLPSYDAGAALEFGNGSWSLRGVYMNIGENDDGNEFNAYMAQLGYNLKTSLGEGNYRIVIGTTDSEFLDSSGIDKESRYGALISFDQEFGELIGGWMRFGWQDDAAAINYEKIYSGGINFNGEAWGSANDNIGLGYAYLSGGNSDSEKARIAEGYYRWAINDVVALTGDMQYQKGESINRDKSEGWVFSIRAAVEF